MSKAGSSLYFSPVHDTLPDRRKTTAESLSANKEDPPEAKCDKKGGSPQNFCLKSSSPEGKSCFLSEHKTSSQVRISLYNLY